MRSLFDGAAKVLGVAGSITTLVALAALSVLAAYLLAAQWLHGKGYAAKVAIEKGDNDALARLLGGVSVPLESLSADQKYVLASADLKTRARQRTISHGFIFFAFLATLGFALALAFQSGRFSSNKKGIDGAEPPDRKVQKPVSGTTAPGQPGGKAKARDPDLHATPTPTPTTGTAGIGKIGAVASPPPPSETVAVHCGPFRDGVNVAMTECVSAGGGIWKAFVKKTTLDVPSPVYSITGRIDDQYCGKAQLDGTAASDKIECTVPPKSDGRLELVIRPSRPAGFDSFHVPISITVTRTF